MPILFSLIVSLTLFAAPPPSIKPDVKDDLEAFADVCGALGWSGTMYVEKKGKVLLSESRGWADVEKERELEPDDAMEIASITKLITAVAVVRLHQEEVLDLDEPIGTYLKGVGEAHAKVTVRHLLSHSSGMLRGAASGSGDDRGKAVKGYLRDDPTSPPGTKSAYWNGGYALLAAIVEELTGETFEEHVAKHVFEPAGMKSATFVGADLAPERQAMGYELSARSRWASTHPYASSGAWTYKGMGGVVCTAQDLARFVRAFADGKLVKNSLVKEMTAAAFDYQGLGWRLAEKGKLPTWSHGGDVAGFHSWLAYLPKDKITVVVMSNRNGAPQHTLALALQELAQGKDQLAWIPKALPWKSKDWKSLEGDWVIEGQEGPSVRIEVSDCVRMTPLTKDATRSLGPPSTKAREMDSFPPRGKNALEPEDFLRLVPISEDELRSRPWSPFEKVHQVQVERKGKKVVGLKIERYPHEPVILRRES